MATNYTATAWAGMPVSQLVGENCEFWTPFTCPSFVINDAVFLCQIPNFCTLTYFFIDLPQLDSATTLTLNIGDNVATAAGGVGAVGYFNASTAGRSVTQGQNNIWPGNNTGYVHGCLPKTYSIANANVPLAGTSLGVAAPLAPAGIWLVMKVATAGTAVVGGQIYGHIRYTITTSTATLPNPAL
jgi:hypothetical protein